jgi:hypothetical protein
MEHYKKFDLGIQLCIIGLTVLIFLTEIDGLMNNIVSWQQALYNSTLIFYIFFGIWQPISAIIHLKKIKWVALSSNRRIYLFLLPLAIIICVLAGFFITPLSFQLTMAVAFAMAVFYLIITIKEYKMR